MEVLATGHIPATAETFRVVVTEREDGDFAVDRPPADLERIRRRVVDLPWVWVHQVHGAAVVEVADGTGVGSDADAMVTGRPGVALAVQTADCAPVALVDARSGRIGVVHAGWRGLLAGVLDSAVASLESRCHTGAISAVVGPCICASHYAFGPRDLDRVAGVLGGEVRSETVGGEPALDLRAGIGVALRDLGVDISSISSRCTAEEPDRLYSHRTRGESGRQALVVWKEAP